MNQQFSETVLFRAPGVMVTDCRLVAGRKTVAIASIGSVELARKKNPSARAGLLAMAIGAACLFGSDVARFVAIACFLLAAALLIRVPSWTAIVRTSAGETAAWTSFNKHAVAALVDAINSAIIAHG